MHDVLSQTSQSPDLPQTWKLKPVRMDDWGGIWSPVHDIKVQHPRMREGFNFERGVIHGRLAGSRYATGYQLVQHARHKLSSSLGVISVQKLVSGYATLDFQLKSFVHRPGFIVITDHLHPFKGSLHRAVGETIYIPRHMLGLPETSMIGPILLPVDSVYGETLDADITRFFEASTNASAGERYDPDVLLHATSSVIGYNRHPVSERAGWWKARNDLIRKYIESNLGDQNLLPAKICSVFNLSRATLYRMFEADGGVRRYIQDRRLFAAVWDLAEGGIKRGRLTRVAEKWGFSSNANFNRAVKTAFGMPPGALFGANAVVAPARLNGRRNEFPTYDWFSKLSREASVKRLRA